MRPSSGSSETVSVDRGGRPLGAGRQTVQVWLARYEADGLAGSRGAPIAPRPRRSRCRRSASGQSTPEFG
jgi:transposase